MVAKPRPIKVTDWKLPNYKMDLPKSKLPKVGVPSLRIGRGPTVRWSIDYNKLFGGKKK